MSFSNPAFRIPAYKFGSDEDWFSEPSRFHGFGWLVGWLVGDN